MFIQLNAQIGIKTATPNIHCMSTVHCRWLKILMWVEMTGQRGNSGNKGEVLMSNGAGNAPVWKTIESENFLKVVYVGNKTDISPASGSYTGTHSTPVNTHESYSQTYVFNVSNKIDTAYLTYNSTTGLFHSSKTWILQYCSLCYL